MGSVVKSVIMVDIYHGNIKLQPMELQRNATDIDMDHICKHQLFGYILTPQ